MANQPQRSPSHWGSQDMNPGSQASSPFSPLLCTASVIWGTSVVQHFSPSALLTSGAGRFLAVGGWPVIGYSALGVQQHPWPLSTQAPPRGNSQECFQTLPSVPCRKNRVEERGDCSWLRATILVSSPNCRCSVSGLLSRMSRTTKKEEPRRPQNLYLYYTVLLNLKAWDTEAAIHLFPISHPCTRGWKFKEKCIPRHGRSLGQPHSSVKLAWYLDSAFHGQQWLPLSKADRKLSHKGSSMY